MKKNLAVLLLVALSCISAAAQKISKPVLAATPPTAAQKALITQGAALHDARQFDKAIRIYEQVLKENPDCTMAMYEAAISYYNLPDKNKALEIGLKGSQYKSPELPLFYMLIANVADDLGHADKAIQLFREGIKILSEEKSYPEGLSSLYYNLGVTHARRKQDKEAREAFKKAVEYNYRYGSPHYLLTENFYASKYKIPALLAAARFISLEFNTARTKRAAAIFQQIIKGNAVQGADGKVTINLDFTAASDEGDFGALDLLLSIDTEAIKEKTGAADQKKPATDEEKFVAKIATVIAFLETGDKKNQTTFVGQKYSPFLIEMKKRNFVEPFAYIILFQNGNPAAEKWLTDNNQKAIEFVNWAKTYRLPNS